jgi:acyl-CoA thioesterase YciA
MSDKSFYPPELEEELNDYREEPMIRVVMMPKDTNALGSIFGGVILSHLDIAAGEEAYKSAGRPCVTKVMKEVDFAAPVHVGDWVSFYTRTERVGNTSVTVRVLVVAHRGFNRAEVYRVTEAEVVFVAIDDNGKPTRIDSD